MTTTIWNCLELRPRHEDLSAGLEARLHDPYWMLARQWQLGELSGQDGGSPIHVRVETESHRLSKIVRDGKVLDYAPSAEPLEALVERERLSSAPDARSRLQAGQDLLRRLESVGRGQLRGALVASFSFSETFAAERLGPLRSIVRRVPDAERVLSACRVSTAQVAQSLGAPDDQALIDVLHAFCADYGQRRGSPEQGSAWKEDRLEYQFELRGEVEDGEVTLHAQEYHGGRLDWDAVDATVTRTSNAGVVGTLRTEDLLPTPVTYAGMPASRFWELEDGRVDFAGVEAGALDLGRLLLAEFAVQWGNDWFIVPLQVEVATLTRVRSLVVTDTFGIRTAIEPQSALSGERWNMYNLSSSAAGNDPWKNRLYVPPVLAVSQESEPVEKVVFVRDEGANVAWAIEHTVQDPSGFPRRRASELSERTVPAADGVPEYQVMGGVPESWVPLVLEVEPSTGRRMFVQGSLATQESATRSPEGAVLNGATLRVHEEEIPREGAEVTRAYQLARWHDGKTHLWLGRYKRPARGEVESGLTFDELLGEGR